MIIKRILADYALEMASKYPVVTVVGPRQSGKTTMVKDTFPHLPYVNLEDLSKRSLAQDDPNGFLAQFPDGAILDEIQRVPSLLSAVQVVTDEKRRNGLFVLTGSQQFDMAHHVSQSLAGRTAILRLLPFSIAEMSQFKPYTTDELIHTGFYPRVHDQNIPPLQAYGDYLETYVERDIRQLINVHNATVFHRFMQLCAGRVGQLLNTASLANDTGVSETTVREWLNLLETSFILFRLQPFHANIRKRLVKTPKLYFVDVGLASFLLGIEQLAHLHSHPLRGNLFENLVVTDILKYRYNGGRRNNLYFYRDSTGNEVDLIYSTGNGCIPIEIKAGQTVSADFFRGLESFSKIGQPMPHGSILAYGGDENSQRKDCRVLPARSASEYLGSIDV